MGLLNFSSVFPAAPSGSTNITFANDSSYNISASFPAPVTGTATLAGNNVFTGTNIFTNNVAIEASAARQQLSIGTGLDLYSGAVNSPAVASIRGTATVPYVNSFSNGLLGFNYDSGTGGVAFFNGAGTQAASVSASGVGSLSGLSVAGAQATVLGVANPGPLTITTSGTAGTTSYSYAVIAIQADGSTTGPSPVTAGSSISIGNATLSASNYNTISWTAVANAVAYNVYRLTSGGSPSSIGKIASGITATSLNDTGLSGDGTTAALVLGTLNTTGLNLATPLSGNLGGWTQYLPTITPSSGTAGTLFNPLEIAQYCIIGPVCHVTIMGYVSVTGTTAPGINISLPCQVVGSTSCVMINEEVSSSGAAVECICLAIGGQSYVTFQLSGGASFASGTTYEVAINGWYRCA